MKKQNIRAYIILAIAFVAYTTIVMAVPFAKGGMFWLTYLFTAAAFGVQAYTFHLSFAHGETVRSKFYGFPIARISLMYLAAQLVLGLVFMALAAVAPLWLAVMLYIVMLAAAAIGVIATDAMREEIERQDVQLKKDVTAMRALQSMASALPARCDDAQTKATLEKLADEFRYSDPVSNDAVAGAEQELTTLLDDLSQTVVDGDYPAVQDTCKKVSAVLTERNRVCKLNKSER